MPLLCHSPPCLLDIYRCVPCFFVSIMLFIFSLTRCTIFHYYFSRTVRLLLLLLLLLLYCLWFVLFILLLIVYWLLIFFVVYCLLLLLMLLLFLVVVVFIVIVIVVIVYCYFRMVLWDFSSCQCSGVNYSYFSKFERIINISIYLLNLIDFFFISFKVVFYYGSLLKWVPMGGLMEEEVSYKTMGGLMFDVMIY